MNPRIINVFPNKNFTLTLFFTNEEIGIFDMTQYFEIGIFRELKNFNLFKTVHLFMDTIQWVHEQDLCPDTLYLKSKKIPVSNLPLIINTIINILPVFEILLFGDYAKGTQNEESNLSLFIIIEDNINIREIDAIKLIRRESRDKAELPYDVLVRKKSTFEERKDLPTLDRIIYKEAVTLYKAID